MHAGSKQPEATPTKEKIVINMLVGGSNFPPPTPDSDQVLSVEHLSVDYSVISFGDADYKGSNPYQSQALIITLDISNHDVKKTLVDNGSSVDVLFAHTLDRMQLGALKPPADKQSLYNFGYNAVPLDPWKRDSLELSIGSEFEPDSFRPSPVKKTKHI